MAELTHLDEHGSARMVDITDKAVSHREATAEASVCMQPGTLQLLLAGNLPKGDVFATARLAGIQAAKKTADLIPLCHPLALSAIDISFEPDAGQSRLLIHARCKLDGKTGVEMEAMTAASVAALTVYDMCKAVEKGVEIHCIRLIAKSGGKSGDYNIDHFKS